MAKRTVGQSIACLRRGLGLTQAELAARLGVSDKSVSKWERELSCPDISLLPKAASVLGVTVDELLSGNWDARGGEEFISLEKYLMGAYGYTVPDRHPEGERVALLLCYPDLDEAAHGYALSGKGGECFNRYIFGTDRAPTPAELDKMGVGVTYVANVPLLNLDPALGRLVDELEYTRLNARHINELLLQGFVKKMEELINSRSVRLIALSRDMDRRYLGAFIARARQELTELMQERIAKGELKLIFVGVPSLWCREEAKKPRGLDELREFLREGKSI